MPTPRLRCEVDPSSEGSPYPSRDCASLTHRSRTASAPTPAGSGVCVGCMLPSLYMLRRRSSAGSMSSANASRVTIDSAANCACGDPNPRNAPQGTLFVYATYPSDDTFSISYVPDAKRVAPLSTSMLVEAYAPPSATSSVCAATIVPSLRAPHFEVMKYGCRLVWPMIDSSRLQTIDVGRLSFQVAKASKGCTLKSSRPPNAPPILAYRTTISSSRRPKMFASCLRSSCSH